MDKHLNKLLLIYLLSGVLMLITVLIRTYLKKDLNFMKFKITNKCNLWCLSHFIMYVLLGYNCYKYWYVSLIMSFIWEYIEIILEKKNIYISSNIDNDLITNGLGLLFGILIKFII